MLRRTIGLPVYRRPIFADDEPIPKIEIYRAAIGKPQLFPDDPHVIASASDAPVSSALP